MWLHKSQIELSTDKKSAGNINAAAFLPSTRVTALKQEEVKHVPDQVMQPAQATQQVQPSGDQACIDLKYDWYQNYTHVFVSYRIKKGGDDLKNGDLKVTYADDSVQLESRSTGEILVHLDFANGIKPEESSYTCSSKKIELKIKKTLENINWIGLERGSATTRVEALQN